MPQIFRLVTVLLSQAKRDATFFPTKTWPGQAKRDATLRIFQPKHGRAKPKETLRFKFSDQNTGRPSQMKTTLEIRQMSVFRAHRRKVSATIGSQTRGKSAQQSKPAKSRPDRPEMRRKPRGMEVGRPGSPIPGCQGTPGCKGTPEP